jgi:hypothetical protein
MPVIILPSTNVLFSATPLVNRDFPSEAFLLSVIPATQVLIVTLHDILSISIEFPCTESTFIRSPRAKSESSEPFRSSRDHNPFKSFPGMIRGIRMTLKICSFQEYGRMVVMMII